MKKCLLIGSSGFLGQCIKNQLATTKNVIYTHYEHPHFPTSVKYDFFNDDIKEILTNNNISTVLFTAFIEDNESDKVSVAMKRLVKDCQNCRFVYVSSDGIFDGKTGQYLEGDEPTPSTNYGQNLKLCERLVKEYSSNYCIIRPSYIYGYSNGKLDNRLSQTKAKLMREESVILFDNMYKSPLGVNQVAEAVIELARSSYIGIVHVAGERLSVYEFQRRAMVAIGVNTAKLKREAMPEKIGYLRDTSLKTEIWEKITGMRALSIEQTLSVL